MNKKDAITSIFIVFCLVGYIFFPANGYFQYKAVALVFLVLLPFLYNKYLLKNSNLFAKITIGNWKKNIQWMAGCVIIALLLVFIVFRFTNLLDHYPLSNAVKRDFWQFLSYELFGVAFTVFLYEIFFRGFVMFYFERQFEKWAILIQALLFFLMLFILQLPFSFSYLFIIFVPFAGLIAYKSESITYSFLGQLIFIIIADASAIKLLVK